MEKLIFILTALSVVSKHFAAIDKEELSDFLRKLNYI